MAATPAADGALHGGIFSSKTALIAAEVGSLHTRIQQTEERIIGRLEAIDARQRRDAGLTTTLMESM
jgi:hypothetical protein